MAGHAGVRHIPARPSHLARGASTRFDVVCRAEAASRLVVLRANRGSERALTPLGSRPSSSGRNRREFGRARDLDRNQIKKSISMLSIDRFQRPLVCPAGRMPAPVSSQVKWPLSLARSKLNFSLRPTSFWFGNERAGGRALACRQLRPDDCCCCAIGRDARTRTSEREPNNNEEKVAAAYALA